MKKRARKKRQIAKRTALRDTQNKNNNINSNTAKDLQTEKIIEMLKLSEEQKKNANKLEYVKLFISIFLSVLGLILTVQSNAIYRRQKEIQEKAISPAIDISVILKEESEEYKNEVADKFIVNNVGGIAQDIYCYVRPFFLIHYSDSESGEELFSDGVVVPIKSYTETVITNENIGFRSGEIARVYPNKNLLYIINSIKKWGEFEFETDLKFWEDKKIVHVTIGYFLVVDCEDLFEHEWTEYYSCFPGYDAIYGDFPARYETEIGVTKIEEDDDIIDIVKSCLGGEKLIPAAYIYEDGKSDEDNYIDFLEAFRENYDKKLFYDSARSGEYILIRNEDGEYEVKIAR